MARDEHVFSDHKWLQLPPDRGATYNAWDIYATAVAARGTREELASNRQLEFFEGDTWPLVEPVMDMVRRGLLLDAQCKTNHRRRIRRQLRQLDEAIIEHSDDRSENDAGFFSVIESNKKLGNYLYNELGLKCHKTTEGGDPSVDQEALWLCLRKFRKKDEPYRVIIENLFHRSRLKTIDERYLDVHADSDGRVRPSVLLHGTETRRFAYKDPPEQQRPKEVRDIYIAPRGFVWIAADYSQLEARIMAYLADDRVSIEVFESGRDIHSANAMDLFGLESEAYAELSLERRAAARNYAKTFLYRLMYGGSALTSINKFFCPCPRCKMPAEMQMSREEIRVAEARWMSKHTAVTKWRNALVRSVADTGWYTSPYGNRRKFMGPISEIKRELYNCPMQSTAADIMNEGMVLAHQNYLMPFVLQKHDEFIIEVPRHEKDKWVDRIRTIMERPIEPMGGVVFPIDIQSGENWKVVS